MKGARTIVRFRRRRKGSTDYRKRLKLLLSGKSRLVIRKSLGNTSLQLAEYQKNGDRTVISAKASELEKYGWKGNEGNVPAAYLTGVLLGEKAKKAKITECVADTGFANSTKGARIYAALKGVLDAGIKAPFSEGKAPSEERISGAHIANYALKLKKESPEEYKKIFAGYLKKGALPEQLPEMFNKTKEAIKQNARGS